MLNELQQLRHSLGANGIQTTAWHPSIKQLAKYLTLLVRLNDVGVPAAVASLPPDRAAKLRSIQPDNQKSFPAFNLNCPIFEPPEAVDLSSSEILNDLKAEVPSLKIAYKSRNGKIQGLDRLKRLLHEFPANEIAPKLAASSQKPLLASTVHLLDLLKNGKQSIEEFLRSFAKVLIGAGLHGDVPNDVVLDVLFGKPTKKGSREPWQCIIFLDLEDLSLYSNAVSTPEAAAAWSEALLQPDQAGSNQDVVQCALDGYCGPAIGDKMPNPNLPLLGGTYLFSMNSEIPCQSRYGQSSTSLFPVTRTAVQGVNDALLHMTAKDMEGKTWSAVPSAVSEKPDLLIAYIEDTPDIDAPVAGTLGSSFGDDESESDEDESVQISSFAQMSYFIQRLDRLLAAVRMQEGAQLRRAGFFRLFVLSTIDKGRKQVLFDARYSVDRVVAGRDRWVGGATNVPALDVRLFQGKGKKKKHRTGDIPSPVAVARSFRALWIRNGERSETVAGVGLGRIYKLLLDPHPRQEAAWLLERFLPLKLKLLIAAGKPSRDDKTGVVYAYTGAALSGPALLDLLTTTATLGILLSVLGRTKEMYMNERDYLLGQLLQFADRLQIVYCHGVRGGQVPPQLIGNSLIDQAGQNPAKALFILGQRLPIYERYATQLLNSPEPVTYGEDERDKEKLRLAKLKHDAWEQAPWIKAMLAKLSAEVHRLGLEATSGREGQAELLLGYLAAPARKEEGK